MRHGGKWMQREAADRQFVQCGLFEEKSHVVQLGGGDVMYICI